MTFNDLDGGSGKNQRSLGGAVTSANVYYGAHWHSFRTEAANHSLSVYRYPDDTRADQVRVRIWRMNKPDYQSGYYAFTQGQGRYFEHGLGAPSDSMLVDVTAHQTSGDHKVFYGRVDIGTGSPFPSYAENDRAGFYWYNLTSAGIAVNRMDEDDSAQSINVRIWAIPFTVYLPLVSR